MIANYHTHTWRCNHADGTEREYVENAVSMDLKILGFSDHTPYIFPGSHYSRFRMKLDQLEDYVETVLALRKEYEGIISLPLGLELEYYPNLLPKLLPILRDLPMDYLIMGQHFIGDEIDEPYSGWPTEDRRILERYVDQVIDGMQTGLFTYVAHPDLLHYVGSGKIYAEQMRRLCREAKACGIPLEINLLGLLEERQYPNPIFWEQAAEEGNACILGRDAHSAEHILDTKTEARGMEIVERYSLDLLETVPLRKI